MLDSLIVKCALIGILGIGSQWIAWRTGRPAIALMLVAGVLVGPVLGIVVPQRDFGELREPMVKLAVAIILFEGGLSLNFHDLRRAGASVFRLVLIGVPVGWLLGAAAAHYGAGLSWGVSLLFGGILVVTGPTVISPMLRALKLPKRVGDTLKWEGIVNDPIGALLAVGIFAWITYGAGHGGATNPAVITQAVGGNATVLANVAIASALAAGLGVALGFWITHIFPRGLVPEYLKAPVLLVTVIASFVASDLIMHETGLITVTVLGMVLANRPVHSSRVLRRFKEDLAVILISGVFIILSASLDWQAVSAFRARFLIFLLLLLFAVRPVTVLFSLMFSAMPWRERLFIAWFAPRGIVAVTISGLFALRLTQSGIADGAALIPLSFGVVIATIIAHGFSAKWLARRLGLIEERKTNVLIVGANRWTIALARHLIAHDLPVTLTDSSSLSLRAARKEDVPIHRGDVLDETTQHALDIGQFSQILVATGNDAYNALVCADLGPEKGFEAVTQTAPLPAGDGRSPPMAVRGRVLLRSDRTIDDLTDLIEQGWDFSRTRLTDKYGYEDYLRNLPSGAEAVAIVGQDGALDFVVSTHHRPAQAGEIVISIVPPDYPRAADPSSSAERAAPLAGQAAVQVSASAPG